MNDRTPVKVFIANNAASVPPEMLKVSGAFSGSIAVMVPTVGAFSGCVMFTTASPP